MTLRLRSVVRCLLVIVLLVSLAGESLAKPKWKNGGSSPGKGKGKHRDRRPGDPGGGFGQGVRL